MTRNPAADAIFGAHLADAAAMGLHWLYDPARIASLDGPVAFRTPDPAEYDGVPGILVHAGRKAGTGTQYGEQMRVMTRSILSHGGYALDAYLAGFSASFGPGGSWQGYIDKSTRGTLAGIAAEQSPTGPEDDQAPALSKLPPLMAVLQGASWEAHVAEAVAATSNHPTALSWAPAAAAALHAALAGADLAAALQAGIGAVSPEIASPLQAGIDRAGEPLLDHAREVGIACPLPQVLPVSFNILTRATSLQDAIETNIRLGGDNCGRAIFIGAMAALEWGIDSAPLDWLLALEDGAAIWAEAQAVAALGTTAPAGS
ncbi:MAG: ADP-ribosylglycohydrolase family protein [Pseudomonadota bacterium]